MEIANSCSLLISNIYCNSTNLLPNKINEGTGGFLRTINILYRKFINVTLENSFSNQTTIGIKIIDDIDDLNKLKNYYGYTEILLVKNFNFKNLNIF